MQKTILAIDPGNIDSAYTLVDASDYSILSYGKLPNAEIISIVTHHDYDFLVIEMIASYGMPVGAEVFETCVIIGRMVQIGMDKGIIARLVYRKEVKLNLCQSVRAKDGNVIQAMKDRFGDKGTKKNPGWFYGFRADCWQAYAVAVTWIDIYNSVQEIEV